MTCDQKKLSWIHWCRSFHDDWEKVKKDIEMQFNMWTCVERHYAEFDVAIKYLSKKKVFANLVDDITLRDIADFFWQGKRSKEQISTNLRRSIIHWRKNFDMEWISVVLDINPTNISNDRIRVVSFEKKRNQEHNEWRCILVSLPIIDYRSNDISSFGIVLIELMYTIILDVPLFNLLLGRYWHETMDVPFCFFDVR